MLRVFQLMYRTLRLIMVSLADDELLGGLEGVLLDLQDGITISLRLFQDLRHIIANRVDSSCDSLPTLCFVSVWRTSVCLTDFRFPLSKPVRRS